MLQVFDDLGREFTFRSAPKRVVSLVPSDTLTLADIGCGDALVGRTDYCELPEAVVSRVPSVGGTKNPRLDAICDLSPDLVLANQEENSKGDIEELLKRGVRVYVCFPKRVAEGMAHLARLGRVFHVTADADVKALVKAGYGALREAEEARARTAPVPTFCPIWMEPLMTIHGETFISDMLDLVGASNVFSDRERRYPLAADLGKRAPLPAEKTLGRDTRYPRVTREEVVLRAPKLVLLPDEPHPFSDADAEVFRGLLPSARVEKISGKDLCWYGSRTVEGLPRLRALIDGFRDA